MANSFDTITEPLERRIAVALGKIGMAMRSHAWKGAEAQRLTPTQGDILALLRARGRPQRLSDVADGLGITRPTACDAVAALVRKGLIAKDRDAEDGRAVALRVTVDGVWEADRISSWPDFLTRATGTLPAMEQDALYQALLKVLQALQQTGDVAAVRTCFTCRHFRPNAHDDADAPHHCAQIGAAMGRRHLRVDCAEHAPVESPQDESGGLRRPVAPQI